ncbi:restin homolog [Oscarella lobularis]|uniref:restin homolog n=1 Tax=Oscarella lobularis TaxID=121494 RepID=UPI0033135533
MQVGERVVVPRSSKSGDVDRHGCIRYLGETQFSSGVWCGLVLDESNGKNDGSIDGVKYFDCPPNRGLFVLAAKVRPLQEKKKHVASSLLPRGKRKTAAATAPPPPPPPPDPKRKPAAQRKPLGRTKKGLGIGNASARPNALKRTKARAPASGDARKRWLEVQSGFVAMALSVAHLDEKVLSLRKALCQLRFDHRKEREEDERIAEEKIASLASEHCQEIKLLARDFEREIVLLEENRDELAKEKNQLTDTRQSMHVEIENLRTENDSLHEEMESWKEKTESECQAKIKEAIDRCGLLPQELESLRTVLAMKDEQIRELRLTVASLQDKADGAFESQRKLRTLEEKCEQWEARTEQQKESLRLQSSEAEKLHLDLQHERHVNRLLNQSVDELQWKLNQYEDDDDGGGGGGDDEGSSIPKRSFSVSLSGINPPSFLLSHGEEDFEESGRNVDSSETNKEV